RRRGDARPRRRSDCRRRPAAVDHPIRRVCEAPQSPQGARRRGPPVAEGGRAQMKRDARLPEPELDRLIERVRIIRRLPDVVRARALARARATVAAAATEAAAPAPAATAPVRAGARRIAVAASIALLIGAAGAVAALRARTPDRLEASPLSPPPAIP